MSGMFLEANATVSHDNVDVLSAPDSPPNGSVREYLSVGSRATLSLCHTQDVHMPFNRVPKDAPCHRAKSIVVAYVWSPVGAQEGVAGFIQIG